MSLVWMGSLPTANASGSAVPAREATGSADTLPPAKARDEKQASCSAPVNEETGFRSGQSVTKVRPRFLSFYRVP